MIEEYKLKTRAENLKQSIDYAFEALSGIQLNSSEYSLLYEAIITLEGILRLYEKRIELGHK